MDKKPDQLYFSTVYPELEGLKDLGADCVANSIAKFAEMSLKGAMRVTVKGESNNMVNINPEYTAVVLRELLRATYLREVIDLEITVGDTLTFKAPIKSVLKLEDIAKIMNMARFAGFSASWSDSTFTFSCKVTDSNILKLYALSSEEFMFILSAYIIM